jgi:hypothetical protein
MEFKNRIIEEGFRVSEKAWGIFVNIIRSNPDIELINEGGNMVGKVVEEL